MDFFVMFVRWIARNFDEAGPVVLGVLAWAVAAPFVGSDRAVLGAVGVGVAVAYWLTKTDAGRAFTRAQQKNRADAEVVEQTSAALESSGLEGVPVAVSEALAGGFVLELKTPVGRADAEVIARADAVAAALGAWRCVPVPGSVHGSPRLLVQQSDPLASPVLGSWAPATEDGWDATRPVPVGRDENGSDVSVSMWSQTVLIGGSPGAGKSAFAWLPLLGVALDPSALVVVIDLKPHGIETAPIAERADHAAYDPESALTVLRRVWELIDQRNAALRQDRREKVPTADRLRFPPVLIVVDEAAELSHSEEGKEALEMLQRIVSVGRASGVSVMLSTQKPDGQTIPTNLRDLFAQRVCFRVGNRAQAETVLGVIPEGAEPWKIPTTQQGTGYLIDVEGSSARFRSMFLDRDQVIEVADRAAAARRAFLEANPDAPISLPPVPIAPAQTAPPRRRRRS